jgi:hypothetical protein
VGNSGSPSSTSRCKAEIERRPRDVIGNAVHVMRIATGQITDDVPTPESEGKDPAAVALGRKGGDASDGRWSDRQSYGHGGRGAADR